MTDISARRRWSARLMIAAAVLALPLTGSISYAQSEPLAPPAPPAPVAPPAAVTPPTAPEPPTPPEAPRVTVSEDGKVRIVHIERHGDGAEGGKHRKVERHVVIHPAGKLTAEQRAKLEKHLADGKHGKRVIIREGRALHGDHDMTAEERAEFEEEMSELRKELREEFGEHGEFQRELKRELGENSEFQKEMREKFGANSEFRREMRIAIAEAGAAARAGAHAAAVAPKVTVQCRKGQKDVTETVVKEGKQHIFVCNSLATAEAKRAIALARAEIARTRELTDRQRAEALRSIDEAERESRAD